MARRSIISLLFAISLGLLACETKKTDFELTNEILSGLGLEKPKDGSLFILLPSPPCIACIQQFKLFLEDHSAELAAVTVITNHKENLESLKCIVDAQGEIFNLPFDLCSATLISIRKNKVTTFCYSTPDTIPLKDDLIRLGYLKD